MVARFVDIGGMIYHHCVKLLFKRCLTFYNQKENFLHCFRFCIIFDKSFNMFSWHFVESDWCYFKFFYTVNCFLACGLKDLNFLVWWIDQEVCQLFIETTGFFLDTFPVSTVVENSMVSIDKLKINRLTKNDRLSLERSCHFVAPFCD